MFGVNYFGQPYFAQGFGAVAEGNVGSAQGTATVSGVGASIAEAVGSSSGTATVSGIGESTAASVGTASGVATVSGAGESTAASVGTASGTSTASGVSEGAATSTVGSSSGTSTASGEGSTVPLPMLLTHEQHVEIALLAFFLVEESLRNNINRGESCVFAGDGIDDLDMIIARIIRNSTTIPRPQYTIALADTVRQCLLGDIIAIRNEFVIIYGPVANPSVFEPRVLEGTPFSP